MITSGIDIGAKNIKAVIIKDGNVVSKAVLTAGMDEIDAANKVFDETLRTAALKRDDISRVFATGVGRHNCGFAHEEITEVGAAAKGISYLMPDVRTVIDIGAEEGRAIRIDNKGDVVDFAINERCAAGAGIFVETMARMLETRIEDIADLYDRSTRDINIGAHCVVFAEFELVHLIHSQISKPDIVRAIITAMADRVVPIIKRIGVEHKVAVIGGVALNRGFTKAIENELNVEISVPTDPQFVSAIGAAIVAAE